MSFLSKHARLWLSAVSLVICLFVAPSARAQSIIREPGRRPQYTLELEPHLLFSPFNAPDQRSNGGYGVGARATIEIVPQGFIPKLNNSVGIGFGLDWVHYDAPVGYGGCRRFESPQGVPVCVDAGGTGSSYLFVPVVMQWNFWLHPRWSVFGEPGIALSHWSQGGFGVSPVFAAGGRFHISDSVTLTMRLGYPAFTLGASFLL